ncbi:MAG: DUF2339 domain-containing protein [Bryobacterales bacterium]|nr:DUF2339 domain-containing protein [Bryobacterales bacterium]
MDDSVERSLEELRAELAAMEARLRALERREVRFGGALVGRTRLGPLPGGEIDERAKAAPPPAGPIGAPPPPVASATWQAAAASTSVPPPPPLREAGAPPVERSLPMPVPMESSAGPSLPPPPAPAAATRAEPRSTNDLESQMGLTWVNRIGAVTLILAAGFVFKYAADNGWIGPWARVLAGLVAGGIACACAELLVRRGHRVVAQGVAGLGIAVFYLSFFAAFQLFGLLPQLAVFGMMAGVTVLGGVLAVRYRSQALAVLAAAGGFLTPVMLSTGENRPWELNAYLLILAAGATYLAVRQRWQGLAWMAYLGTKALYWAGVFEDEGATPYYPALVFGVLYYALFLCTPWAAVAALAQVSFGLAMLTAGAWAENSMWSWQLVLPLLVGVAVSVYRKRAVEAVAAMFTAHAATAFGLLMMLEASADVALPKDAAGMGVLIAIWAVFAAWAIMVWLRLPKAGVETVAGVFAINSIAFAAEGIALMEAAGWETKGAFAFALAALHWGLGLPAIAASFGGDRYRPLARALQGLGVFFLACAIPLQLHGPVIAAIWAGMGLALAGASQTRRARWMEVAAYLLFFAALSRLVFVDLPGIGPDPVPFAHGVFFTALIVGASMLGAAWFWGGASHRWGAAFGGHFVVLMSLIVETVRWGERGAPGGDKLIFVTAIVSVILSVYAAVLVAVGVLARSRANRVAGLVLLMVVVAKLYLFDVWLLDTLFRIVAFGVLGAMLLATSFLYSRMKGAMRGLLGKEGEDRLPPPAAGEFG